jgi:hypothetical protein
MRWERGQNTANMRKYALKYARNMRNPKNGVGSATPYLITQALLFQNMMIFFDQKKVLNPQGTFLIFFQNFWYFEGSKNFLRSKIFIRSLLFWYGPSPVQRPGLSTDHPWSVAIFSQVMFTFQCAAGENFRACPPTTPLVGSDLLAHNGALPTTPLVGSDLLPVGGLGGYVFPEKLKNMRKICTNMWKYA